MIRSEEDAREWLGQLPEADPLALQRLARFAAMVAEENQHQNLVSAASLSAVWARHIADSAQLLTFVPRGTEQPWLDLGTGSGFPGVVISILRPDVPVIMVESRARRVEWLQRVVRALELSQADVRGLRLEQVGTFEAGVISARAFAPLDRLLDLSARFSTADTTWLLPKGRSARDEVNQLTGWAHLFHVEQSLTDPEAGIVVGTVRGRLPAKKVRKR